MAETEVHGLVFEVDPELAKELDELISSKNVLTSTAVATMLYLVAIATVEDADNPEDASLRSSIVYTLLSELILREYSDK